MIEIILYTKPDCGLCDDVRSDLRRLAGAYPHRIVERDICADPSLLERFRLRIPVLVMNRGPEIDPPHTLHSLERALAAAQQADHESAPR